MFLINSNTIQEFLVTFLIRNHKAKLLLVDVEKKKN